MEWQALSRVAPQVRKERALALISENLVILEMRGVSDVTGEDGLLVWDVLLLGEEEEV